MLRAALLGIRHPHVLVRRALLEGEDDVELLGFWEEDDALAQRFAARTGLRRAATPEDLLLGGLDLAVVEALDTEVTPVALRAAPHCRALLLEKPGAPDLATMRALVEGLRSLPVDVTVGYELHHAPAVVRARELLGTGALGQLTMVRARGGCPVGCGDELWQSVPGDLGGVMYTEGCHLLELLLDALGAPEAVQGTIVRLGGGEEVSSPWVKRDLLDPPAPDDRTRVGGLMYEDVGAALLHYPETLACLDVTAWEPGDWVSAWELDFVGTQGSLRLRPLPGEVELVLRAGRGGLPAGRTVERWEHAEGPPTLSPDAAYGTEMTAILERLRTGAPPAQASLDRGFDVVRVLDAIYRSSEAGGGRTELG